MIIVFNVLTPSFSVIAFSFWPLNIYLAKPVYINYRIESTNRIEFLGKNVFTSATDCLLFLWEHSFKFPPSLFCHIYFFARTECPSKVRFAQTNRLKGQKLSDVWLLFPPLYINYNLWKSEYNSTIREGSCNIQLLYILFSVYPKYMCRWTTCNFKM